MNEMRMFEVHSTDDTALVCIRCAYNFAQYHGGKDAIYGQNYRNEALDLYVLEDVFGQHADDHDKCDHCGESFHADPIAADAVLSVMTTVEEPAPTAELTVTDKVTATFAEPPRPRYRTIYRTFYEDVVALAKANPNRWLKINTTVSYMTARRHLRKFAPDLEFRMPLQQKNGSQQECDLYVKWNELI